MSLRTLPAELRHEIYSHLLPLENIYWSFHDDLVSKISHKPPPSALLRVCRFLNDDAMAYYYSIATIQVAPDYYGQDWNYSFHGFPDIRRVRNVEVEMLWWYGGMSERATIEDKDYNWPCGKAHELATSRLLNKEAHCMRKLVVTVYWYRKPDLEWELIQERLDELREVKSGVVLVAGKVTCHGSQDEGTQKKLREYVRKLNAERA